jgi:hypothetical protein
LLGLSLAVLLSRAGADLMVMRDWPRLVRQTVLRWAVVASAAVGGMTLLGADLTSSLTVGAVAGTCDPLLRGFSTRSEVTWTAAPRVAAEVAVTLALASLGLVIGFGAPAYGVGLWVLGSALFAALCGVVALVFRSAIPPNGSAALPVLGVLAYAAAEVVGLAGLFAALAVGAGWGRRAPVLDTEHLRFAQWAAAVVALGTLGTVAAALGGGLIDASLAVAAGAVGVRLAVAALQDRHGRARHGTTPGAAVTPTLATGPGVVAVYLVASLPSAAAPEGVWIATCLIALVGMLVRAVGYPHFGAG